MGEVLAFVSGILQLSPPPRLACSVAVTCAQLLALACTSLLMCLSVLRTLLVSESEGCRERTGGALAVTSVSGTLSHVRHSVAAKLFVLYSSVQSRARRCGVVG